MPNFDITSWLVGIERIVSPLSGFIAGFFGFVALNATRRDKHVLAEVAMPISLLGVLGLALCLALPFITEQLSGFRIQPPRWHVLFWLMTFLVGSGISLWWYRQGEPRFNSWAARFTIWSKLVRDTRTDIRDLSKQFSRAHGEYDPRRYYQPGRFFLGLSEVGMPIYWPGAELPHVSITGSTGCGKGRKLQDLAAQSIANGEALIYLDPKDDEWAPHAVYAAAVDSDVTYAYIRLLPDGPPAMNLLDGCTAWEISELFSAAMNLDDRGNSSDFYRAKDRAAAEEAAKIAAQRGLTSSQLYQELIRDEYWAREAPGFISKLREVASVSAVNGKHGFDLQRLINEGGAVYIVGSMTSQSVKRVQQMILIRTQQLVSKRDRFYGPQRTVCVVADEAKYHISRPILQGLGASRDKGMRVLLAYQSFADLRDCPEDLNPISVVAAIVENTPCKFTYRIEDPETANWLARKSGTIFVEEEIRHFQTNIAFSEVCEGKRSLHQAEAFLIDENRLLNLPPGLAIVYGAGLAQPCVISPYRVTKARKAITPIAVDMPVASASGVGGRRFDNEYFSME